MVIPKTMMVYSRPIRLLISSMLNGLLCLTWISLAAGGTWTEKAEMPTARQSLSTSTTNGQIYAIGGWSDNAEPIATVEAYDPVKNKWTRKADIPTPRGALSTCVVNGKIYAIGGAAVPKILPTVEVYDPATSKWTKKADMPTARYGLSAAAVSGKIYAIGGAIDNPGPAIPTVEEYDPMTDTWTKKADMPTARHALSTSVVNGEICAIGGSQWNGVRWVVSPTVEVYDPVTDTWTKKADMPTARVILNSTCVVNGRIYAIGGWDGDVVLPTVEAYDPATDRWTREPDMPTPRAWFSTSVTNRRIYAIGGADWPLVTIYSTVEEYDTGFTVNAKGRLLTLWGRLKATN